MSKPSFSPAPRVDSRPPYFQVIAAALIVTAIAIAYGPAVHGDFIWDDDAHVTRPELRSLDGLYHIWFHVGVTQQYYPLLHTFFWIEHRLWGDSPTGYHLVNMGLHACAAVLVMVVLRRWLIDGKTAGAQNAAFLTAAVFALHPVNVESVAWITEQKNTLSAVFYLAAMWAYLRFDRNRRRAAYGWATTLFIMGLFTKTVTATLPAALLILFWWQRGKLTLKRDVVPLLPWFVMGAAAGLFTAWVEHDLVGARGQPYELSGLQRLMLAGRVVWFYLYKLAWPAELIFIYPRWTVDPAALRQWLYPIALVSALAGLALYGRRNRSPLAALLFFVGSLFPVLGFFNVFPFLYSFVADHFQYLAGLGIIALVCGFMTRAVARAPAPIRLIPFLLPAVLGILSFRQCRMYADAETLYRTTIKRNPACWMAYNNLGVVLKNKGRVEEAIEQYRLALERRADYPEAFNNLGAASHALGRYDDALAAELEALRIRPDYPEANFNVGVICTSQGKYDEAIAAYEKALQLRPDYSDALDNLAVRLIHAGRAQEAVVHLQRSLQLNPGNIKTRLNLGIALGNLQRFQESADQFAAVIREQPDNIDAHWNLAVSLESMGRGRDAIIAAERARELAELRKDTAAVEKIDSLLETCREHAGQGSSQPER